MGDPVIGGTSGRRHWETEDEALRHEESSGAIVRDATKADIRGSDLTWRETKDHQKGMTTANAVSIARDGGLTAFEAAEGAGAISHGVEAAVGAGTLGWIAATTPIVAFGLGLHMLSEAHEHAVEQGAALAKDDAHVALIANLKLPDDFKNFRFEGKYANASRDGRTVEGLTTKLRADPQGCAVLQLHADRGMIAARDCVDANIGRGAFLAANPKVAEAYRNDAAFHEGFDAWLYANGKLPEAGAVPTEQIETMRSRLKQDLEQRDARYTALQVPIAV